MYGYASTHPAHFHAVTHGTGAGLEMTYNFVMSDRSPDVRETFAIGIINIYNL